MHSSPSGVDHDDATPARDRVHTFNAQADVVERISGPAPQTLGEVVRVNRAACVVEPAPLAAT